THPSYSNSLHNTIISAIFFSSIYLYIFILSFFFFNDTATTEIYTLSLHDALPILKWLGRINPAAVENEEARYIVREEKAQGVPLDRKSTRLNSSHVAISYAVFCLKKKKKKKKEN